MFFIYYTQIAPKVGQANVVGGKRLHCCHYEKSRRKFSAELKTKVVFEA